MESLPRDIFILVHGSNGSPRDFDCVETILELTFRDNYLVHKSHSNHSKTHRGIESGGRALADEILEVLSSLPLRTDGHQLSIISHSLGGLFSRMCMFHLLAAFEEPRWKAHAQLVHFNSFVSLCSPHLGSRRARGNRLKNIFRYGVHKVLASPRLYGQTGVDLLVSGEVDSDAEEEVSLPLLQKLCEDEAYLLGLRIFQHRTLVALTYGDLMVPFASASLRDENPYPPLPLASVSTGLQFEWEFCHSGFCPSLQQMFLDDESNGSCAEERRPSLASPPTDESLFSSDERGQIEFLPSMLERLGGLEWRRLELSVRPNAVREKFRLHDWPIDKCQPSHSRSKEFIRLLVNVLMHDHYA
jgi:pimeloyl-ACP methyl ester carboxylesterase